MGFLKSAVLFFSFMAVLSACGGGGGGTNNPNESAKPPQTNNDPGLQKDFENQIKIEVTPLLNQIYHYRTVISWPPFEGTVKIKNDLCLRHVTMIQRTDSSIIFPSAMGMRCSLVLQFLSETADRIYIKELNIPEDLHIKEPLILKNHTEMKLGRLKISDKGSIITEGYNLKLSFDELNAEGQATIQNFPKNARAQYPFKARSGGLVQIQGRYAQGKLFIQTSGEAGANGRDAVPRCVKINDHEYRKLGDCLGGAGKNSGNAGEFTIKIANGKSLQLQTEILQTQGGVKGMDSQTNNAGCSIMNLEPENCYQGGSDGLPSNGGKICVQLADNEPQTCKTP